MTTDRLDMLPFLARVLPAILGIALCACSLIVPGDYTFDLEDDAAIDATLDGGLDGAIDANVLDAAPPDSGPCIDGTLRCSGDMLEVCAAGTFGAPTMCGLGCRDTPSAHCAVFIPSLPDIPFATACGLSGHVMAGTSFEFDTETGVVRDGATMVRPAGLGVDATSQIAFNIVDQSSGPRIGVFSFLNLTLGTGLHTAVGPNALALVVCDQAEIRGTLSVSAFRATPGPGGDSGGATGSGGDGSGGGGPGSTTLSGTGGGGGGAGYGSVGGIGAAGMDGPGGARGFPFGESGVITLLGGSGGGSGGGDDTGGGGAGGGGGGALYIAVGSSLRLAATAIITAGGGGGINPVAGGGGGSGGTILIEAPGLSIIPGAGLFSNGGAGASNLGLGENGRPDLTAAGVGRGGLGGVSGATNGGDAPSESGGGGSVGRIRIGSQAAGADLTGVLMSPAPTDLDSLSNPLLTQYAVAVE